MRSMIRPPLVESHRTRPEDSGRRIGLRPPRRGDSPGELSLSERYRDFLGCQAGRAARPGGTRLTVGEGGRDLQAEFVEQGVEVRLDGLRGPSVGLAVAPDRVVDVAASGVEESD